LREYLRTCLADSPEFLIFDAVGQDVSGMGKHAALNGAQSIQLPGPAPRLRPLRGLSTTYLQVPFTAYGGTATVECWYNSTATSEICAFGSSRTAPTSLQSFDFGVGCPPTGSASGRVWCGLHTDSIFLGKMSTATTYADGQWHHFVATWGGTADVNQMHMFVDGVWVSSTSNLIQGGFTTQTGANNYWIWRTYTGGADYPGSACLWAWYPTRLTDERILAHYRAGLQGGYFHRRLARR
jgi:hypothetical protein